MQSFFQIINEEGKTGLRLVPGEGGKASYTQNEIVDYLTAHQVPFNLVDLCKAINTATTEVVIPLCHQRCHPISEEMQVHLDEEKMTAVVRFYAPSNDGGKLEKKDIIRSLHYRSITFGVDEAKIDRFLETRCYNQDIIIAKGIEPIQGEDAWIEYFFNTNLKARPTLLPDGSVDFHNLNIINHCKEGDLLAKLHPAKNGKEGRDVLGNFIKPREVKHVILRHGRNVAVTENHTELHSEVNGHVTLVEGKVFVSDVMVVENVDNSTGNIEYEGNVQVNGTVRSHFSIHAKGNIEVRGVVEGAELVADGNITIARGMNGMNHGVLKAGGNIIAHFIENAEVEAKGYVESGSIVHSNVMAGTEIHVGSEKGFIAGGHVCATGLVDVKILGSELGVNTVVEIGVNPAIKKQYHDLKQQISVDMKTIHQADPVLTAAKQKIHAGIKLSPEQVKHVQELSNVVTHLQKEIEADTKKMDELEELLSVGSEAQVVVHDKAYPGTKIVITDVSKILKQTVHYCRFVKAKGDVMTIGM